MTDSVDAGQGAPESAVNQPAFKQRARSEQPVVTPDQPVLIGSTGDTTVLLEKDATQIKLFDTSARSSETPAVSTDTMIMDWKAVLDQAPTTPSDITAYVIREEGQRGDFPRSLILDELDAGVRPSVEKVMGARPAMVIPSEPWRLDTQNPQNIVIDTGKDCVIIYQPGTSSFVAYQTRDSGGEQLPPDQWLRVDSVNKNAVASQFRDETKAYVIEVLKKDANLRSVKILDSGTMVRVFTDRVVFTKNGVEFTDQISRVDQNLCEDPQRPGVLYYYSQAEPNAVRILDTSIAPPHSETMVLPPGHEQIANLAFDSTGNFLTFSSRQGVIILGRDLTEVARIPSVRNGVLDQQGILRGIDAVGHLVTYDIAFGQLHEAQVAGLVTTVQNYLGGDFSYDTLRGANQFLDGIDDKTLTAEARGLVEQLRTKVAADRPVVLAAETTRIQGDISSLRSRAEAVIGSIATAELLRQWRIGAVPEEATNLQGFDLPTFRLMLERLRSDIDTLPERDRLRSEIDALEASALESLHQQQEKIQLQEKSDQAERQRTEAALRVGRITALLDTIADAPFARREDLDASLPGNRMYLDINAEIDALRTSDPKEARRLRKLVQSQLALARDGIERRRLAPDGQVRVGSVDFPIRKEIIPTPTSRTVGLTFLAPEAGAAGSDQITGDIGVLIRENGNSRVQRLFEGFLDEGDWRAGTQVVGAQTTRPTMGVNREQFSEIQKLYNNWRLGDRSSLRQQRAQHLAELRDYVGSHQDELTNENALYDELPEEYRQLNEKITEFEVNNHISILQRMDSLARIPEPKLDELAYIPKVDPTWTIDGQTQRYLTQLAQAAERQLDTGQGVIILEGHTGTGKDVLLDIFAAMTHRPKFDFNASKWDDEATVTETLQLQVEDGSSVSVTIPSSILKGIQTEGAIVYVNEINTWPVPTRLFLNSLFDAKREVVLNLSGKRIKVAKDVIFVGSQNAGYAGTNEANIASTDREQTKITVDYPPLRRRDGTLNSAEAWRMARDVASLEDYTYEMDPQRSDFLRIWERYANENNTVSAPPLSNEKIFDLKVIKQLLIHTDKLRKAFMEHVLGTADPNTLPVTHPVTGRLFATFAYELSRMASADKRGDPNDIAKRFFKEYFLGHILRESNRTKVSAAIDKW